MGHDGLTIWGMELPMRDLTDGQPHAFKIVPHGAELGELAAALGLSAVKKLRFEGVLEPAGKRDWRLKARLGATVVQPCEATLVPVTTRVEDDVARLFIAGLTEKFEEDSEDEMPEDDTVEPLPAAINLAQIAEEALALAAPAYPRAEGAELGVTQFTEAGKEAMSDDDAKPFAGLKALRDKLGGDSE